MIDTVLVPEATVITAKGDGAAVDISAAQSRVFLLTLNITDAVEQESIELSVFGSPDGTAWAPKPSAAFPQSFYPGQTPILLDLRNEPEVKSVRAHWEVNRWGRGSETPRFALGVTIREIPQDLLREVQAQAKTRA
ncbi:MAG TPA: hypothetical protein VN622_11150 [Clostridia bacterium]|nr:hypothetical protein [Clostridia bacterium]